MRAVILAGGIGSRLWPLSRELYPKQLLSLLREESLLQATVMRAVSLGVFDLTVVAAHDFRFYVREQIENLSLPAHVNVEIVLEPCGRNTAAAIAVAALLHPNETLWVMPADHVLSITDFDQRLSEAADLARQGGLVTFGVVPNYPEIGYGYIQKGDQLNQAAYTVKSFTEKPSQTVADAYLQQGDYFWNSGMFCFQSQAFLDELASSRADIRAAVVNIVNNRFDDLGFVKFLESDYLSCPSESVDYAVMEHTQRAVVLPLSGTWSDVGSWRSLYALHEKDASGNAVSGDVVIQDTTNSLLKAQSKLVAVVGMTDVAVVETEDAVLVADMKNDQSIKSLVTQLKATGRVESKRPRVVYRPWGHYEILQHSEQYELRSVSVKPAGEIQLHQNTLPAKYWLCTSGQVEVEVDGQVSSLAAGCLILISESSSHCLCNNSNSLVTVVEWRLNRPALTEDINTVEERSGFA